MDLLRFQDELDAETRASLRQSVSRIDYPLMKRLFESTKSFDASKNASERKVSPVTSVRKAPELFELGQNLIRGGEAAAVTMAGGQGTRLGHKGPKGTYDIGLPSHRSLFELQCDSLRAAGGGTIIPWYIMTGEENHAATVAFFEKHGYFGYGKENIRFFRQGTLPLLNTDGEPFLSDKGTLCTGPDGNGGVFRAAAEQGVYEDMETRGVKYVFICGVDNAAVRMADPALLGLAKRSGSEIVSKSVAKRSPEEKAGVFCLMDGKPGVIEYSELPDELRYLRGDDGELVYNDANIIAHVFPLDVLKRISETGLPYHTAFKKMPYVDETGAVVVPEKENAYKYETFVFDAFAYCRDMTVMRVDRKEFSPVKNRTGQDSPETARAALEAQGIR